MLGRIKSMMSPLKLNRALKIVSRTHTAPEWLEQGVRSFIDHAGDVRVTDVEHNHVHLWFEDLRRRKNLRGGARLSPYTVDTYARAVRAFFNHLVKMGHLEESPWRIRLPKLPKKSKKAITEKAISKMLDIAAGDTRNFAMLLVTRDTGCRIGELLSMTVSRTEVSDDGGKALTLGKMNKHRYIFFGPQAAAALGIYLRSRRHIDIDDLWLTTTDYTPLTKRGAYAVFRKVGKAAGVDRYNPHAFRHHLATKLIIQGVNPRVIQEILGHEDVSTTLNMYGSIDDDQLQALHRKHVNFDD